MVLGFRFRAYRVKGLGFKAYWVQGLGFGVSISTMCDVRLPLVCAGPSYLKDSVVLQSNLETYQ